MDHNGTVWILWFSFQTVVHIQLRRPRHVIRLSHVGTIPEGSLGIKYSIGRSKWLHRVPTTYQVHGHKSNVKSSVLYEVDHGMSGYSPRRSFDKFKEVRTFVEFIELKMKRKMVSEQIFKLQSSCSILRWFKSFGYERKMRLIGKSG